MMTEEDKPSIKRFLSNCQARLWQWLSVVLSWMCILYVSAVMLIKFDSETTNISGAVFVVVAVLAGLAFTYAGLLPNPDQDRADVIYAGERLCHGAIIFLSASILKYGTIVIPSHTAALIAWKEARFGVGSKIGIDKIGNDYGLFFLQVILQIFLFLIFIYGLLVAYSGYQILGRVVMRRTTQRQKADGYFPPAE